MLDSRGKTIYIGKARNLRSRVRSYYGRSTETRAFHHVIVTKTVDIDHAEGPELRDDDKIQQNKQGQVDRP